MRQPWRTKPVIFRIVVGSPRETATPARSTARPVARPPSPTHVQGADPKIPWKTITAVAGAGILGIWLLRPTRPPGIWVEASRQRIRRLEEFEDRLRERERKRDLTRARQVGHAAATSLHRPIEKVLTAPVIDEEVGESSVLDDSEAPLDDPWSSDEP